MKEIDFGQNLQHLMRVHGNLSVSELAKLTQIPQPTLHHILTGSTKNPRLKALEALANYFSVTVNQLRGRETLPNVIPEKIKEDLNIGTIPIISWDMLKNWPKISVEDASKELLLDRKVSDHSFALIIDTSMEPLFQRNTLLIFDAGRKPLDRDFVIAHLCQNDEILFERYFIDQAECYIKQNLSDGNVKLVKFDSHRDRIIGTLIEARVQY